VPIAAAHGQRIYTLTQANMAQLANVTIDDGARSEISNALYAGKEVTVHATPLSYYGWQGSGYTIIDPETGAGAWKISGGANGGYLSGDAAQILGVIGFALGMFSGFAPLLFFIAAIIAILLAIELLLDYLALDQRCAGLGLLIALALLATIFGIFTGGVGAIIVMYIALLAGEGATTAAASGPCRRE
jgi:hypothetical protein